MLIVCKRNPTSQETRVTSFDCQHDVTMYLLDYQFSHSNNIIC